MILLDIIELKGAELQCRYAVAAPKFLLDFLSFAAMSYRIAIWTTGASLHQHLS